MHSSLRKHSQRLSRLYGLYFPTALFLRTLSRVEALTHLYSRYSTLQSISFFCATIRVFFLFFGFILRFPFYLTLKSFRAFLLISASPSRPLPPSRNLFITYGDCRSYSNSPRDWNDEIFRGFTPSDHYAFIVIPVSKSLVGLLSTQAFINQYDSVHLSSIYNILKHSSLAKCLWLYIILSFRAIQLSLSLLTDSSLDLLFRICTVTSIISEITDASILDTLIISEALDQTSNQVYDSFIWPWESQVWERIFCHRAHLRNVQGRKPLLIGYQHTGFSYGLLQHFIEKEEVHLNVYPQYIFTSGDIQRSELLSLAPTHHPSKFITVGSLRCATSQTIKCPKPIPCSSRLIVTLALGHDPKQYPKILGALKLEKGIDFLILPHPLNKKAAYALFSEYHILSTRHDGRFQSSDIVLVDNNSLFIESWYFSKPAVILDYGPPGLHVRDFQSPILHVDLHSLSSLRLPKFRQLLYQSGKELVNSGYISRYFKYCDTSSFHSAVSSLLE